MTINKPIVFVGVLAILAAAAVARLHAAETVIASSWDAEERMIAAREMKADAIALENARQLKKEAESQTLVAAWLRTTLLFISVASGIAGVAVLCWAVLANRRQQSSKDQWTQQLALLGRCEEEATASRNGAQENVAQENVAVPVVRFDPARYPKTIRRARKMSILVPVEPVGALRRAA